MSREAWRADVAAGRAFACNVDESGGLRDELPPGLELLRYQRRLALEQRAAEEQRDRRRRHDEAAG